MMYQSSGYDDWASEGETELKWEMVKGCLFWAFIFIGSPILIMLVSNYLKG